ncbi:MAG: triose-phosphate isomerase [Deltaproteobacteria bacterium]|nr:triose-phosphate isomerase [Deltaproteobacteria bacterium]MBW1930433.1 triose-phosphate isomerase [Deltaproteobacteria bacterium]MBW2025364.1 triose-phosphate isomerase [Deltaproteobacteria bacterium]MBW2125365.1 triose-phosphate isomerase [Deltaproteobacteria bacterium]RLB24044.1 MAG: triose-phosphate isomerase [Deltaproteobacteria bacterium]
MIQRSPLIAGNWKMHLTIPEATALVRELRAGLQGLEAPQVLVAPPFTSLGPVKQALEGSSIMLGAQNMHWEDTGAFTGEISGQMLLEVGCSHVILGHSERRLIFKETDDMVDKKVQKAVALGLSPILCIGETLEQREAGNTYQVLREQLEGSLASCIDSRALPETLILAYEPVWAIGTGKTATPAQAQEAHQFVRTWIQEVFGEEAGARVRILYGGSVKPENIRALMAEPDIDGALVGGASLKPESFLGIIRYGD